jgi:O-antigen/teichoic acid export membrane protein
MNSPRRRQGVLRSALLMTGATYINYGTGLVISMLIARHLGPAEYGKYAYLIWLTGVLIALVSNGLTTTAIRFVSESNAADPAQAAAVHGWLKKGHLVSQVAVAAAFLAAVPFLQPAGWQGQLWAFAALTIVCAATKGNYIFNASVAKGYGQFSVEAVTSNLMSVGTLIAVVALTLAGARIEHYLAVFLAASVGHALIAFMLLKRAGIRAARGALPAALQTRVSRHFGWTLMLTLTAAFGYGAMETFLLNRYAGAEAVGFFLLAAALAKGGVELLSSGLSSVLMSQMAHAYGAHGDAEVDRILSDNARLYHFLGLVLAGVGFFWAEPVVRLMYGTRYDDVAWVLQAMVLISGLAMTEGAFGARLSTTDHQRARALIVSIVAGSSALLAFLLVPAYGLKGALISLAVSRGAGVATVWIYTIVSLNVRLPYWQLATVSLLAALSALPAWLLVWAAPAAWHAGVLLGIRLAAGLLFAGLFLTATIVFRCWNQTDLAVAARLLARIPGLRGRAEKLLGWGRPAK